MNNNTTTIPVGTSLLGRALNSQGEPIDNKGSLGNAQRVPLYTPPASNVGTGLAPTRMLETGIKVIDLMAPLPHGGVVGMVGGVGVGKMVVTEEILHNLITHHNAFIVFIGMSETTYGASELRDIVRDIEAEDRSVMVFEQATNDRGIRQRLLRAGLTIAMHFRDQGYEALLVVDDHIITKDNIADLHDLKRAAAAKTITTLMFEPVNEAWEPVESSVVSELDGQLMFSRELAKQSIWPAIDPILSHSRLLEDGAISAEHAQVAREVKQLLQRYHEAQGQGETDTGRLSEEDRRVLQRGERIQLFFAQPFFVAEAYTDTPGEYLPIQETVRSFKELLEGRYDDVPAQRFYFVGTIDQALAKA